MSIDWRPGSSRRMLAARDQLLRHLRDFLQQRGYLEVDPPALGRAGSTDTALESFSLREGGEDFYLHTSPEFFMKRLLAAGSGPIFALGKVYRRGEAGRFHNPEFTMLEWYRPGFRDGELMEEVGNLLSRFFRAPVERLSYRQAFQENLDLDPHAASAAALRACAEAHLDLGWEGVDSRDLWLDLLFSHLIQPRLQDITLIYDYPASQAALARVRPDPTGQPVARRFEAFYGGVELANGYWELSDAGEQAERFAADNRARQSRGRPPVSVDHKLLEALEAGLPDCAGVALGVDRLLMLVEGADSLDQVMPFAWSRI